MYIIVSDTHLINGKEKNYFYSSDDYYNPIKTAFESISALNSEDIDEILIFSKLKDDATKNAKIAKCLKIDHEDNAIRVYYSEIKPIDAFCGDIQKRLYGNLIRRGLIEKSGNTFFLNLVDDINDYNYLKGEKKESEFLSIMAEIEVLEKDGKWKEIIDLFPKKNDIDKEACWEDYFCLSKLEFALSMILNKKNYINYESFFEKVNERCLAISKNSARSLSTKAYYHYNKYTSFKNNESYDIAISIYPSLIELSKEYYKELYRYTKLRQTHFSNPINLNISGIEWFNNSQAILKDYKKLIDDYDSLENEKKKKYKKYYIRSVFGYSVFSINVLLNYWQVYYNNKLFNYEIKDLYTKDLKLDDINYIEGILNKLSDFCELNVVSIDHVNSKPNCFDIWYRIAQIKQIKGIYFIFKEGQNQKSLDLFDESNKILKNAFEVAIKYKNNQYAKFKFPDYIKSTQAINYYFLGEYELCHKCFNNARNYMLYEEAIFYLLQEKKDKAISNLSIIPNNDKCYNKAQKLIERIKDENE